DDHTAPFNSVGMIRTDDPASPSSKTKKPNHLYLTQLRFGVVGMIRTDDPTAPFNSVGMTGFEPATTRLPAVYATGLRHIPKWICKDTKCYFYTTTDLWINSLTIYTS